MNSVWNDNKTFSNICNKILNILLFVLILSVYIFNFQLESKGNVLTNIIIILFSCAVLINCFLQRRKIRFNYAIISLFLFITICFISLSYSVIYDKSLEKVKTLFANLFFFFMLIQHLSYKDNINYCLKVFSVVGILASIYVLFNYDWGGMRANDIIGNANTAAIYLSYGSVFTLYFIEKYSGKKKYLMFFFYFLQLLSILIFGSRTAIFIVICSLILMFVLNNNNRKISIKKIKTLFLVSILGFVIIWSIFNIEFLYNIIGTRLESMFYILSGNEGETSEGSTQERFAMFNLGLEIFFNKPLLGCGIGGIGYYIKNEITGYYTFSHNNYIELLSGVGIIGFILYYFPHIISLKNLIKKNDRDFSEKVALSLLILLLISHIGIVHYYYKLEFLFLAFIVVISSKKKEINYEE